MRETVTGIRKAFRRYILPGSIALVLLLTVLTRISASFLKVIPDATLRELLQQISAAVWTCIAVLFLDFRWCWHRGSVSETFLCGSVLFLMMGAGLAEMIAYTVSDPGQQWQTCVRIMLGVVTLLRVGFYEESVYRGIIANGMCLRYGTDAVGVWLSVILSGAVFGAAHMTNMFYGVDLSSAVAQSLTAWVLGMYFAAVYLRGRNIWVMMLLHSLTDSVGLFETFFLKDGGTSVEAINEAQYSPWYYYLAFIVLTAFLLRRKKIPGIINSLEEAAAKDAEGLGTEIHAGMHITADEDDGES